MADQIYYSVFTQQGLALLTEAIQNGTKLGITSMAFGDGGGSLPEPQDSVTALVNEVYRTQLNSLAPDPNNANWLRAEAIIASAIGGFNIRELGLYAGDVLVAYSNYPATYKPNPSDGTARIMTFRMVLQIDNTANFDLVIDPDIVLATVQYVNENLTDSKIKTWSGISLEKHNKVQKSILDFGGVEGDTCPRLSDSFSTLDDAKAAYPDIADKITTLDLYVNDVAAWLADNSGIKSIIIPSGLFKFKDNYSFPVTLAFTSNDQSYIKFDNYYWVRRWDGETQKQTIHVYFEQSNVTTFVNDVQEAITWIAPNTFTVTSTAPKSTSNWKISIANAVMTIGCNFTYPRINTVLNFIPKNFTPSNELVNGRTDFSTGASNISLGTSALESLTTGAGNVAIGASSGGSLTTGINNNFIGFQTGHRLVNGNGNDGFGTIALEHLVEGNFNTAIGNNAQGSKRTGNNNVSVGGETLWSWDSGNNNSALGYRALANGAGTGENNVAIGTFSQDFGAGNSNTSVGYRALNAQGSILTGNDNLSVGAFSCRYLAGASARNTVFGTGALSAEVLNSDLSAFGYQSLASNKGGTRNSAFGTNGLKTNISGNNNSSFGYYAGQNLTSNGNCLFGAYSGANITTGNDNSVIGDRSGQNITTGSNNVSLGARSLDVETSGNNNTSIGYRSCMYFNGSSQNTAIGFESLRYMQDGTNATLITNSTGIGANSSVSGSNQVQLGNSATTPYAYAALQLRSDIRDKTDIEAMSEVMSDFILRLKPVQGRWDMRDDYVLELFPLPTAPTIPTYVDLPVELSEPEDNEEAVANYKLQLATATSVNEKLKAEYDAEYAKYTAALDARNEKVQAWWANPTKDASKKRCRKHNWFIAQEVKALADQLGIDFAGLQDHKLIDGTDTLTLGYEEFIPPMVLTLQKVWTRLDAIDERLKALETL